MRTTVFSGYGCAGCHSDSSGSDWTGTQMDFTTSAGISTALRNVASTQSNCGLNWAGERVDDNGATGDPQDSFLMDKIIYRDAEVCGDRMPDGGSAMSTSDVNWIRRWICTGAD